MARWIANSPTPAQHVTSRQTTSFIDYTTEAGILLGGMAEYLHCIPPGILLGMSPA
jgi:hypothetical protein